MDKRTKSLMSAYVKLQQALEVCEDLDPLTQSLEVMGSTGAWMSKLDTTELNALLGQIVAELNAREGV